MTCFSVCPAIYHGGNVDDGPGGGKYKPRREKTGLRGFRPGLT